MDTIAPSARVLLGCDAPQHKRAVQGIARAADPPPGIATNPSGMAKTLSATGLLSIAVTCSAILPSLLQTLNGNLGLSPKAWVHPGVVDPPPPIIPRPDSGNENAPSAARDRLQDRRLLKHIPHTVNQVATAPRAAD